VVTTQSGPRFSRRFRVRHYELDALGHLNNVVFVNYMQEAAVEASAVLGFNPEWYRDRGEVWVVRRLEVRYLGQVAFGDAVDVATWASATGGVRSVREYDLTLAGSATRVARARAEWAYVDVATGQPAGIPDVLAAAFGAAGGEEDLGIRTRNPRSTDGAYRYVSRRPVQFRELDTLRHVNHAAYLDWVGQAYFDATRSINYPPEQTRKEGWMILQAGHSAEFLAPAVADDNIEVVSWVSELGGVRGAWTHEIYNADTRQLLARDYSLGVFVNLEGRPCTLPRQAVDAVLRGPTTKAPV
jgi:acyl-CoA thioester hydrolase